MSSRSFGILAVVVSIAVLLALLAALWLSPSDLRKRSPWDGPLAHKSEMVDRLDFYDSAPAFDGGRFEHASLVTQPSTRVVLNDQRTKTFPRYGTWTSGEIETAFPFTELIPSWNVNCPKDTGVWFSVRVRDARTGRWSDWMYLGRWGRTLIERKDRTIAARGVQIDIDYLVTDSPSDAYQVRATLQSFDFDKSVNPSLRRVTVAYSGQVADDSLRTALLEPVRVDGGWARSLDVPFRAQGDSPSALQSQICSPTSTTMVMSFMGEERPTVENALAIYDDDYDMFGNWNRAVARAGELGLDAWLQRFRNWDQVKAMIARDQPIIASIRFRKGEFPSHPLMQETAGHLIVIRGFTQDGNVIVNDPARKEKGNAVVYNADELGRAWFGQGGVGYVIRKPASTRPTAQNSI